jgi:hypothetical protein
MVTAPCNYHPNEYRVGRTLRRVVEDHMNGRGSVSTYVGTIVDANRNSRTYLLRTSNDLLRWYNMDSSQGTVEFDVSLGSDTKAKPYSSVASMFTV